MAKRMEHSPRSSICSLTHGSLAEGGATVDSHLMKLCRPHYKPPSVIVPVGTYLLPLPHGSANFQSGRNVLSIHFAPQAPSLLLARTSDDALLSFDLNCAAFFSETHLINGRDGIAGSKCGVTCLHVSHHPAAPLVFAGSQNGDVLIFDTRMSGLNAKFSGQNASPTLRLPAAHDGALCGISTAVALHPHLFFTGGREDRWLRIFDLRFPFHYSSGASAYCNAVPYPMEATRLGPSADDSGPGSNRFVTFDMSPDGSMLAASVIRYGKVDNPRTEGMLGEADGETFLFSLAEGTRALKTIASADGFAVEYIEFSPNGKYILQTGGVRSAHCKQCWQCACSCVCGSYGECSEKNTVENPSFLSVSDGGGETRVVGSRDGSQDGCRQACGVAHRHCPKRLHCLYHRAQLVNLIQSNRSIHLKSPADGSIAFADTCCLSHTPVNLQPTSPACNPADKGASCPQVLLGVLEGKRNALPPLHYTLNGPRSRYMQRNRQRFWDFLARLPNSTSDTGATSSQANKSSSSSRSVPECLGWKGSAKKKAHGVVNEQMAMNPQNGGETIFYNPPTGTKSSLFPLLHPQMSQFLAACGPLHPAFVRAEAATFPFRCRLWGGLVIGFGGSTAVGQGRRRLYDGLKLWDSTTGVVLTWAEGPLASEDCLECLAPVPDVSTGLLATGGYMQLHVGSVKPSTPSPGVTLWSLRRRDDLLLSSLGGSFSLEVASEEEEEGLNEIVCD